MDLHELYWAAGFLDGEGCFRATNLRAGRHPHLVVSVSQVDRRPLDRLTRALGGAVHGPYAHGQWQPLYQWGAGAKSAFRVVQFLSEPKQEQFDAARVRVYDERALRRKRAASTRSRRIL